MGARPVRALAGSEGLQCLCGGIGRVQIFLKEKSRGSNIFKKIKRRGFANWGYEQ